MPKGRRFGATRGAANFCIQSLLDGDSILWIDTVQANLDAYFFKYFLPSLKQIKPKHWRYRTQHKDLVLLNRVMDFRSAEKPQNIEGFGYKKIFINEAGIVLKGQKGRDMWYSSVYPMILDYGSQAEVYFIGTPKGRRAKKDEESKDQTSLYYELCLKGGLDPSFKTDKYLNLPYTSYDNPLLESAEIDEMANELPWNLREQEIYGKFVDVGDEEVYKEEWFNVVHELPKPETWKRVIISMDTAFKKGAENDFSAAVCLLETVSGYFLVDMFNEKLEFPELLRRAEEFYIQCDDRFLNHTPLMLIEDKASGTSLTQMFKEMFPYPVMSIVPLGDKLERANAVTPLYEGGKIHLLFGGWNKPFINQLCVFNNRLDTPDDIVDAQSQLFNYIKGRIQKDFKPVSIPRGKKTPDYMRGYE